MEKIFKVVGACMNALMTLIIIVGIIFIVLFCIGLEPFVVRSGSMESLVMTGSLCIIDKNVQYEDIKEGDIIAFEMSSGERVTHRVVSITENGLVTKGDANPATDGITTTKENFIGKNIFSVPKIGYVVAFIQTPRGKIILGTVIVFLLLTAFLTGGSSKKDENKEIDDENKEDEDKVENENKIENSNEEIDVDTKEETDKVSKENTEDENV